MAKQLKEIEIPFGAKDSELCGWEYTIPEGMEATIVDNKIVVRKKDSEDERIRKELMQNLKERFGSHGSMGRNLDMPRVLAWFEKQKPAWSEEDERIYQSIIDDTVQENQLDSQQIDWLKSLKERIKGE